MSEPSSEDKIEEPPLKEEGQPTSSSKRQRGARQPPPLVICFESCNHSTSVEGHSQRLS